MSILFTTETRGLRTSRGHRPAETGRSLRVALWVAMCLVLGFPIPAFAADDAASSPTAFSPSATSPTASSPVTSSRPTVATDAGDVRIADDGTGVVGLLYLRPFVLEEPWRFLYTKEQPEVTSGFIAVLEVDPELARPRQTDMSVLFAGSTPVERTNNGDESGRVIVLLPDSIDPATAVFFFGSDELPERIDRARGELERDRAVSLGIVPRPAGEIEAALATGGETLRVRNIDGVYRALADLIPIYSPQEQELAETYRLIP
ncbi:MAG: hypothetical protein KC729_20225 [Candidatus Eisenbacteria bacterium]|uniref:Uncharacterized protein n=1 Tax=Eiseniibacteriota bacterium TaxID=2212470 RepID=A0A956M2K3_UNCEI|nr:hypothetical protein [Candidatus Eisenbacteria bacterium]